MILVWDGRIYMKNKKITIGRLIIIVLIILLVVIGGTYAWFTYKSRETALVLSIGNNNNSRVIIRPYEIRDTMTPVNTYTSGVYSQVQAINNNSSNTMAIVLYYRINQLDETLINNGLKYTIVSSNTLNGQYTEVKTGDFKELYEENELIILNDSISSNTTMYYKVYLWLDSSTGDQSLIQNLSIDIELNGKIWLNAMAPVLDKGMIPVIISDAGIVTTTFFNDMNWYNYQEQKWANAVLVSDSSRQSYVNTRNVVVDPSDILAYYVWIPRYKYKIWTTSISSAGQEQPIDILFESNEDAMSEGTAVGEYRTHPAFWWDDNNDGTVSNDELLPGIWVGKFETTGTKTAPTILPNVSSLRSINLSTMFNTALIFSSDTTYGLSGALDSHMMKVSEWGAVAYLSHSIYGINEEIRVNNFYSSSNTKTGCGASSANAATATSCQIAYGTPSSEENTYPQSTTGNISGVFDMSGGAHDALMINYNGTIKSSGFTTATFPESKYYDKYTFTAISSCTTLTCGGHAMFETYNWYSDNKANFSSDYPWYSGGGLYSGKTAAGIFSGYNYTGASSANYSFRSVLIPKSNYVVTFDANGGSLFSVTYDEPGSHSIVVPENGTYMLEVWGAQGGTGMTNGVSKYAGGYGSYSNGKVLLSSGTNLYVYVGGKGEDATDSQNGAAGGYNGGGTGGDDKDYTSSGGNEPGAGGGGATHIATVSGELSSLSPTTDIDKILIVAGGGGGGAFYAVGGHAGGIKGTYGNSSSTVVGTQTSGYAFGLGGNAVANKKGSGGGGAGYYGGGGGAADGNGGGGGSGYIGNDILFNKSMYCYNCTTSSETSTLTYSTTNFSSTLESNYAKSGDGAAKIFHVSEKEIYYGSTYGQLPTPTKEYFTFLGWYTKQSGGVKVTSDTIVSIRGNHTIYAHWQEHPYYLITYDANGGTGGPGSQKKYESVSSITLSDTIPTRTGYAFLGWSTNKNATQPNYNPGDEYSANSNITLYALWRYVGVISCSLSASETTITANMNSSEQLTYYGWNSSYTGENSDTTTITATGTFTFYLMNELNNRASCSGLVSATTKEAYCACGYPQSGACYTNIVQNGVWVGSKYCGEYSYRYECDTDAGYSKLNDSYCWKAG